MTEQISTRRIAVDFLKLFAIAQKNLLLYTEYHPQGKSSLKKCYDALLAILKDKNEFTISAVDDRMLADENIIDEEKYLMSSMAKEFNRRNIFSITFQRGISRSDLKELIDILNLNPEKMGEEGSITDLLESRRISFIQANAIKYGRISESQELLDIALAEHIITGIKPHLTEGRDLSGAQMKEAGSGTALFIGEGSGMEERVEIDEIMSDPMKISLLFARTLEKFKSESPSGTLTGHDVIAALERLGTALQAQAGGRWNQLKLVFARLILNLKPEIQHLLVEKSSLTPVKDSFLKSLLTYLPEEKVGDLILTQYLAGLRDHSALADFISKVFPDDERREDAYLKIFGRLADAGVSSEEIERITEELNWLKSSSDERISSILASEKIWSRPFSSIMELIEEAGRMHSGREAISLIQKYMSGLIHPSPEIRRIVIENSVPVYIFMKEHPNFAPQRIKVQNLLFRRLKDENDLELFESIVKTIIATAVAEIDSGNYAESIPILEKLKKSVHEFFTEEDVRRDIISFELSKIETEDLILKALEDYFSLKTEAEQNLPRLLQVFSDKVIRFLVNQIAKESNRKRRFKIAQLIRSLEERALPDLIQCLNDERWYLVRNAVFLMGEIGDPSVIRHLKGSLQHPDHRVRRETIRTLRKLGGDQSIDLIASALEDSDESVIIAAIESLGHLKSSKGIFKMLRIISRSNGFENANDTLRKAAIENLGKLRVKDAVPELIKLLMKKSLLGMTENPEIRLEAIKALSMIGGEEAIQALILTSEKDPVAQIREIAATLAYEKSRHEP
ncbi:MAG: HEAT repeat domain-containing protein [Acidobacteriota bacterium]